MQLPETSSELPVAHSEHQAGGDESPLSVTPTEHQQDSVMSPVCPTEHQQDVYDPPVATPKQERDAGHPPVALSPGEQHASEPQKALQEYGHGASERPIALPEHVLDRRRTAYQLCVPPPLDDPVLDHEGLDDCDILVTRALQSAYANRFPAEATKTHALGFYAQKLKPYIEKMPGWDPEKAVNPTERNFAARVNYDANMLERLMTADPEDLHPDLKKTEYWLHPALTTCMYMLPNFQFEGWAKMSMLEFERDPKLEGNASRFLHHLFSKHDGEVILVHREDVGVVARPWDMNVYHPQFYTDAHVSPTSKYNMKLAADFFWSKKGGKRSKGAADVAYLRQLSGHDNSVLKSHPYVETDLLVKDMNIKYHSLQSLVYECCSVATLHDIYSWFCMQPVLCSCKPLGWHRGGQHQKQNYKNR